jgi:hypothetical protein
MQRLLSIFIMLFFATLSSAQWNPNTSVNLEVSSLQVSDMQSVTTSEGKTWVAYYSQDIATGNYDMRVQLIDKNGVKLFGNDGLLVDNQPSGSATFVYNICLDETEDLIVAYQDERNGSGTLSVVAYKISQSGVSLWGTNGVDLGEGIGPYPAALSNGEVVVAYNDALTNSLSLQKITVNGAKAWFNPIQVYVGTTATTRGQVVPNLNGYFTLVFQKRAGFSSSTLYAQRYFQNGTAIWNDPILLNSEATAPFRYYSVLSEGDTTYCGFYTSPGFRFNSWLQRINPDGTLPYGNNGTALSTANGSGDPYQQTTKIASRPGSPYVWSVCSLTDPGQSLGGVAVQRFLKSNGSRQLGNTAKTVFPINSSRYRQEGSLSLLEDAPFFMVYADSMNLKKLFATRLDTSGNFVWPGNLVEMASTSSDKGRFGFSGLQDLQAVAVWTESRSGSGPKAYAQNITPGGLFGIKVSTEGGIPAITDSISGKLQVRAVIYPSIADQSVNWSVISVGGSASVDDSGLVSGINPGLVWVRAVAVQDNSLRDSILAIIRPFLIPVDSLRVVTASGRLPILNDINDTLKLKAIISPDYATDQQIDWSIAAITGNAQINNSGLVTSTAIGTVWGRAVLRANPAIRDSILIDILRVDTPVVELFGVFPNPSSGKLKIRSSNPHPKLQLSLFDASGRKVAEFQMPENIMQSTFEADLDFLPSGVYFIRSSDEKYLKSVRWVKI